MSINNLSPVDNPLASLHHSGRDRHAAENVILYLIRHILIIAQIISKVIIDIARLQFVFIEMQRRIIQDIFISCLRREKIRYRYRLRHCIFQYKNLLILIFFQLYQLVGRKDFGLINIAELFRDLPHIFTWNLRTFPVIIEIIPQFIRLCR